MLFFLERFLTTSFTSLTTSFTISLISLLSVISFTSCSLRAAVAFMANSFIVGASTGRSFYFLGSEIDFVYRRETDFFGSVTGGRVTGFYSSISAKSASSSYKGSSSSLIWSKSGCGVFDLLSGLHCYFFGSLTGYFYGKVTDFF
jgi:hypothetical protein